MMRVVVAPFRVAQQPEAAGHFWVYLQYLDALRRIGCDVWWLEELSPKVDPAHDAFYVNTLADRLATYGIVDRLIVYRWPGAPSHGARPAYLNVSSERAEQVLRSSDLLLNFHYVLRRAMLERFRRTALIDIDPGLLQLWWANGQLDVNQHDAYFSIGEHLGNVPGQDDAWVHTPPAVSLDLWPYRFDPACRAYTSISSWHSSTYVLVDGELMDTNKKLSYRRYLDLPLRSQRRLELATTLSPREQDDRRQLIGHGWTLREARAVAGDPRDYQRYIQSSRGELGLAKPLYVSLGNAWFSDRTACYLASGKPAIVESTGASRYLPDGVGLLRFSTPDEAVEALACVDADYERHCRAAREIAEASFSATTVVTRVLDLALGSPPVRPPTPPDRRSLGTAGTTGP